MATTMATTIATRSVGTTLIREDILDPPELQQYRKQSGSVRHQNCVDTSAGNLSCSQQQAIVQQQQRLTKLLCSVVVGQFDLTHYLFCVLLTFATVYWFCTRR